MRDFFWYFIFYSFLGFLLEVAFARLTHAAKQDRKGMLLLPLCPVYGLGALLILALPEPVRRSPPRLFFCGALAATAAEYAVDWFCDRVLRVRFWDYSDLPWNLRGRVCLLFSAAWGALALALTAWVHPILERWAAAIPAGVTLPAVLLLLLDAGFTVYLLRATGSTDSLRWYDRLRRPARERSYSKRG